MSRLASRGIWAGSVAMVVAALWLAGQAGAAVQSLVRLNTPVHTLSLADYATASPLRPAPLSSRIVAEVTRDQGHDVSPAPPTPPPNPASGPTAPPTPSPPTPSPTPMPGLLASGVYGTVRSGSLQPLVGARVQTLLASTQTDASGAYSLSLPPGSYSVTASADGYAAQSQAVQVPVGGRVNVNFALTPVPVAGAIAGLVVDRVTGLGIPNASVLLSPGGLAASTDATGAFAFDSISAGTYTVTASATGYATASQTVVVAAGQRARVTFKLALSTPLP